MVETIANPAYEALARRFKRFADTQYRGESPLYEHLALAIAADHELLAVAAHAAQGHPAPNLLLAAVHFLLLKGQADPLAQFYPNLTSTPAPPDAAYPAFRAFCLAHAAAIRQLLATRRIQTDEVGRCAYLLPAFTLVATLAHERPLAQIEIGTSAGLNLLWDRYGYRDGQDAVYGDLRSPVQTACTLHGNVRPPLPDRMPAVALRVGVELHVVDVHDAGEALWLRALVWPEQLERADLLQNAMEITRHSPLSCCRVTASRSSRRSCERCPQMPPCVSFIPTPSTNFLPKPATTSQPCWQSTEPDAISIFSQRSG
jgi:hypothetical protein